jgi:hypothetical protein
MKISDKILLIKLIKPLENDLDSNLKHFTFNKTPLKQQLFFEMFNIINDVNHSVNEIIDDITHF